MRPREPKRIGEEEGAEGMGAFAPKQDEPCAQSQASLELGYPSSKNLNCCILCLSFQSCLTVKNHQEWEPWAERACVMPEKRRGVRGSLLGRGSL